MKVNFLIRKREIGTEKMLPIEMSISVNGKRRYISTGRKVQLKDFNAKTQTVKGNPDLNDYLSALRNKLYSIETILINKGITVTLENVIDYYRHGEEDQSISLMTLFEKIAKYDTKRMKQKLISPSTCEKYLVTKEYVKRYLKDELKRDDILIKNITPSFINNLYVYLLRFMSINTAIHKMKQINRLFRYALDEGYINKTPCKIKFKEEKKTTTPLTLEEVNKIRKKKLEIERLSKVRDLFVFCCYTGLSFSDLMSLNANDFHTDEEGNQWIIKKRHKTKIVATIPLLPVALEILNKYNYQLPKISNVKYNAYLKELADLCGIKQNLHSHLARHTFATILLNSGLDMVYVAKCLGHSSTKITESTYAKVLPNILMEKIKKVNEKISEKN